MRRRIREFFIETTDIIWVCMVGVFALFKLAGIIDWRWMTLADLLFAPFLIVAIYITLHLAWQAVKSMARKLVSKIQPGK